MNGKNLLFEIAPRGETLVVKSARDLTEFAYDKLEDEAHEVLSLLERPEFRNVVVDLSRSDYCSSTALGLFLKFWKSARDRGGAMVFCGLSPHEHEVFRTMKLDALWPICQTLDEALKIVGNGE